MDQDLSVGDFFYSKYADWRLVAEKKYACSRKNGIADEYNQNESKAGESFVESLLKKSSVEQVIIK